MEAVLLRDAVFLRRVTLLRFADVLRTGLLRAVLLREVFLRFAGDFLRRVVDFLRLVVFLLRAGARRLVVDLRRADVFLRLVDAFLLAIVFPPLERALALRLLVFLRLAAFLFEARRLAGLRGFKITTSDNGMVLSLPQLPLWYKGVVGVYVLVIQNCHN